MTQDTTTMPVMASDTAALVEAMARANCRSGSFDPDEMMANGGPRWRYYEPGCTAAYNALRDTLVPVVWAVDHPEYDGPVFGTEFTPLTPEEAAEGFTMYALHTLPELKP